MLICLIEVTSLLTINQEPIYWTVARYNFDPGLKQNEFFVLNWYINDKRRKLNIKVLEIEKTVYPAGSCPSDIFPKGIYPSDFKDNESVFLLRIFGEAEDRDEFIEIVEFIKKANPGKFDSAPI
jgi:hypothetical protein